MEDNEHLITGYIPSPLANEYSAKDIQVLKGLEPVRRRPGMYIGSTDQKGLHHLILEVVYNSIDEAVVACCDKISVILRQDGSVKTEDNGRGIPVETHPDTGLSALETVMTTLHAGAKFGSQSYKVSGGLHGVGVSVVNALSSWFRVEVKRDGKLYYQEYCQGIPQCQVTELGDADGSGTLVEFIPDKQFFGEFDFDFEILAQRLRELAYLVPGLEITLQDELADRELTFYFEGGLASFIRYLNRNKNAFHPPIYLTKEVNGTAVEVSLQYTDTYSELVLSFANCINTADGGSHLTGFRSAVTRVLNDYLRQAKLIKDGESGLIGEDVREGLTAVISVKISEPQFEGQVKAKLGNPEVKSQVESVVAEGLGLYLEQHPNEAKRIIEKCLATARARDAARKARELVLKKSSFEFITLPGKLADCSEKEPALREIYIVEGESAGGSAKQGRDRGFQAILPLKGKILNVEKASLDKTIAHEEIRALITALGIGMNEQLDMTKLRYYKVIIMTDADVDGSHIRTLLLTFFFRYMGDLIEQGHLFIAQPPLYRLQVDRKQYWLYSENEKEAKLEEWSGKKVDIQRYKGLGEMSPQQLWDTTMNPDTRTLIKVEIEDAAKADQLFHILMGDEVPPRKAFIQAYSKNVRNLDI